MKKVVVSVIALFIVSLLYWEGGHYGKGPSTGAAQDAPNSANLVEGQENDEMPLSPGAVRVGPAGGSLSG